MDGWMDGWIAGRATHQHKYTDPDERSLIRSPRRCVHNTKNDHVHTFQARLHPPTHSIAQVLALGHEGIIESLADVGVLFRTKLQSRVFEEAFSRHRIPHRVVGTVRFYARKEVKDLVCFFSSPLPTAYVYIRVHVTSSCMHVYMHD